MNVELNCVKKNEYLITDVVQDHQYKFHFDNYDRHYLLLIE